MSPAPIAPERFTITPDVGDELTMPLVSRWKNQYDQLQQDNDAIRRVIVAIHGDSENIRAQAYCRRAYDAAVMAGVEEETLIIAPDLLRLAWVDGNPDNQEQVKNDTGLIFWTSGMFTGGLSAANYTNQPRNGRVSVMSVLNQILRHVNKSKHFPNLRLITVVGHSGGGNTVSRFAAVGLYEPAGICVSVKYVSMNGYFLYFSPKRFEPSSAMSDNTEFEIPNSATITWALTQAGKAGQITEQQVISNYNRYEFGVEGLDTPDNLYLSQIGPGLMKQNFERRAVTIMAGGLDSGFGIGFDYHHYLQGLISPIRAQIYQQHLLDEELWNPSLHKVIIVPYVGHNSKLMMESSDGLGEIFPPLPSSILCNPFLKPLYEGLTRILRWINEIWPGPPEPKKPPGLGPKR